MTTISIVFFVLGTILFFMGKWVQQYRDPAQPAGTIFIGSSVLFITSILMSSIGIILLWTN